MFAKVNMVSTDGVGSGIATVCSFISSRMERPRLNLISGGKRDVMVKKREYKETEYSKKLRDPRWQRKRLEIMKRDEFTCIRCGDGETTLNVHHCYYEKSSDPWEYADGSLITLCQNCHEIETTEAYEVKRRLINAFCKKGMLSGDIDVLAAAIEESEFHHVNEVMASIIGWSILNDSVQKFLIDLFFRQGCYQHKDIDWDCVEALMKEARNG